MLERVEQNGEDVLYQDKQFGFLGTEHNLASSMEFKD